MGISHGMTAHDGGPHRVTLRRRHENEGMIVTHPQFAAGDELRDLTPQIAAYADLLQAERQSGATVARSQARTPGWQRDTTMHVEFVGGSVWAGEQLLFDDYVAWNKVLYTNRGLRLGQLTADLADVRTAISHFASADTTAIATAMIDAGLAGLDTYPADVAAHMSPGLRFGSLGITYLNAVLVGDKRTATRMVFDALEGGVPLIDVYAYFFEATQRELGRMWQANIINVAQEHMATEATHSVMAQLYAHVNTMDKGPYTVVTAAAESDQHGVGAQIVADFFEMGHWESFFLGANTPMAPMLATVAQVDADVLALSVTMTSQLQKAAEIISALHADPDTAHVRTLVGGHPFNIAPELWRTVGADAYAPSAREAVVAAERLMSTRATA